MSVEYFLRSAYAAFNARDMERVLIVMHADVVWPNGMEGGTVRGLTGVRDYWTRQWSLLDPHVEPLRIATEPDGRVAVTVQQVVRDLSGQTLKDGVVQHVYQFEDGLIKSMDIRESPSQVASNIGFQQGAQYEGPRNDY